MRTAAQLAPPSRAVLRLFHVYLAWYVPRHFHSVRVANLHRIEECKATVSTGPLILCVNHPSWWDPLACLLLARATMPGSEHYAPMDAAALNRYGFMRKLGLFPVEQASVRGAAQFLHAAEHICSTPGRVLWLTPQGAFADVRQRPLHLKPGLSVLLSRLPQATLLPVAIEYTFWDERLPELLMNCGQPVRFQNVTAAVADRAAGDALVSAQDELAALAMGRNPQCFRSLIEGRAGVSGVYQLWQRFSAAVTGRSYKPGHGSIGRP